MRTLPPGILPVVAVDRASTKPLYRQLYEGYRDAIVERRLRGGQRLPSTRSLARELSISRIPVLNAFEQLLAEGYFESRVGAGTFVASALPGQRPLPARDQRSATLGPGRPTRSPGPEPARSGRRIVASRAAALAAAELGQWFRGPGAFNVGMPPVDRFPIALWSRLVARHSRRSDPILLRNGNAMGLMVLREAVAEYLRTSRGVRCDAEQIMIVSGSQQALDVTARALLDPESPVWIEEPGYFGGRNVLGMAGARLVPVPVDSEGLIVSEGIARSPRARAAFVTPSHQYPLGVTMSASRRLQLLDWARGSGSWIIEDDYDSEYRFGSLPITSLQGLDRDSRVIYIGTFTKMLFPALRLGYLVVPADLVKPFAEVRRASDFYSPTFHQSVLADFIREGHFARHIRRTREICRLRREALVEALARELPAMEVLGDTAGMFLSAAAPRGFPDREVALRTAREGLWTAPLSECYLESPRPGFVLGYGGANAEEIAEGVRMLARVTEELRPARKAPRRAVR